MAAYAALVSVMHIIETIQNHPRPPISFDKEQLQSLTQNITFLQELLETHSIDDDGMESRIADAAYAAEDVIESYVVDQIEASETISCTDFYDGLHKVIQDLDLIQRDMTSFAERHDLGDDDDDDKLLHNNYSLRRLLSSTRQDTAVGFDDVLIEVMNKLTCDQSKNHIIPIVGMGGIGKTTLATNIYINPVIVQHFYFRGWATISQQYKSREILLEILLCLNKMESTISLSQMSEVESGDKLYKSLFGEKSLSEMSEVELGDKLYKSLFGRRYLIVLDDIWSIEAWDKVKTFFPVNNDGSAIMLTTRISNLAFQLGGSCCHEMSFLDEDKSWNLFSKSTFGEECCPHELEGIGKKIVENCKGLPLSIVVIGGLLANSKRTREYWLHIAGNLNSILNLHDDERILKILYLSYKELPAHLKPCFIYMGVFSEDSEIDVTELMRIWVAEGFLKPISGKCLEVVAKGYFNDLVARNLILVDKRGHSGETIRCKVHDLLVDICVKEAQKHKFVFFFGRQYLSNPRDLITQRRVVFHDYTKPELIHVFLSHGKLVRSITCKNFDHFRKSFNGRMLRVLNTSSVQNTHGFVNCRYISGLSIDSPNPTLPSSIFSFWNLQTLFVSTLIEVVATSQIWNISQLRHVYCNRLNLLDPPLRNDEGDDFVLVNLQTLSRVRNFKFREDVVKRISNLKKLRVHYYEDVEDWSSCCLNNLVKLINLESLSFRFHFLKEPIVKNPSELLENLSFPHSLKKLTLEGTKLDWEDMGTKIGSLPHLQVLKLKLCSFVGAVWETVDDQFRSLKYLEISGLSDLKYWRTESCSHFPCLEHIHLSNMYELKEIPSEIGETLKLIEMFFCSDSAVFSANEILKEQQGHGNEGLQVKVQIV